MNWALFAWTTVDMPVLAVALPPVESPVPWRGAPVSADLVRTCGVGTFALIVIVDACRSPRSPGLPCARLKSGWKE